MRLHQFLMATVVAYLPFIVQAQGIKFLNPTSWREVLQLAKNEDKYILVDCYTTWCVPCKKMDKEVFTNPDVGAVVNDRFVAAKFQMDKTSNDSREIVSLYSDADMLSNKFEIMSYPSILFLSPEGNLIYRCGSQKTEDFLKTINTIFDSSKNMNGRMKLFKEGKIKVDEALDLITDLVNVSRHDDARMVASLYKAYLDKLPYDSILNIKNLHFVGSYVSLISPSDTIFKAIYKNQDKADAVWDRKGWSKDFLDYVVLTREVQPLLSSNESSHKEIDWVKLKRRLANKYDPKLAERVQLDAMYEYYFNSKKWNKAAVAFSRKIERFGLDTANAFTRIQTNQAIWNLHVLHIEDSRLVRKAANWMKAVVQASAHGDVNFAPQMDTYANLLYKLGRINEAIKLEERAIAHIKENKLEETIDIKDYEKTIIKMRKREKTW
jgi:thioredoxin-related protein